MNDVICSKLGAIINIRPSIYQLQLNLHLTPSLFRAMQNTLRQINVHCSLPD